MSKLRVMVLMHTDLVPPESVRGVPQEEREEWKTEYHVITALRRMGHEVLKVGATEELMAIREAITTFKPHVAFNLLEEFHGQATFDQHVVSFLELVRLPYTGCNPRGLTLARDKALSKKILAYHRIPVPKFAVFPMRRKVAKPRRLPYPLFVKSLWEQASLGISQASIVDTDDKLAERVAFIHERVHTDAIAEQYIEGRELYVGVLGSERLVAFPAWEMRFTHPAGDVAAIATRRVKWDMRYQKRHGIKWHQARLSEELQARLGKIAKRVYRGLSLSGYARMDFRMTDDGQVYLLEANPNPNIAWDDEFAASAEAAGLSYDELLQRILNVGIRDAQRRGDPV